MIKNNIYTFIFHIFLILLSTIYLGIITNLGPFLTGVITIPLIKGVLVAFWAGVYIKYGSSMKLNYKSKYDFHSGTLILIIGFILWIYSYFNVMLFNIFLSPIYQICIILNIEFNLLVRFICIFVPTILIGIGTKYKRLKYGIRKQRAK